MSTARRVSCAVAVAVIAATGVGPSLAVVAGLGAAGCLAFLVAAPPRRPRVLADGGDPSDDRLAAFARTMAHDLRNPIDVARIRVEAARDTGEDVHFERALRAIDRIEHLIEEFDSLAVAEGVDVDPEVAVEDVARNAWETVDTRGGRLEVDDPGSVAADAGALRRIFENLFRNAVEHGSTDSRPGADDPVLVTVGGFDEGFYVADDGVGVPPADRERVFEPGFSTSERGTGLGLDIVSRLAAAHDWQVDMVESRDGGARIEFQTG